MPQATSKFSRKLRFLKACEFSSYIFNSLTLGFWGLFIGAYALNDFKAGPEALIGIFYFMYILPFCFAAFLLCLFSYSRKNAQFNPKIGWIGKLSLLINAFFILLMLSPIIYFLVVSLILVPIAKRTNNLEICSRLNLGMEDICLKSFAKSQRDVNT